MFNKIRFENKINIKMWGCFGILESFVGERVNKIKYDGSINKEIKSRVVSTYVFGKEEKNQRKRGEPRELRFSTKTKVRVSLAYNYINL